MKMNFSAVFVIGLACSSALSMAQADLEVEKLKAAIHQLQVDFEHARQEHQAQLEVLGRKVAELSSRGQSASASPAPVPEVATTTESKWSAAKPIGVGRSGSSYMNISFDAVVDGGWSTAPDPSRYLQLGDHDPIRRGFTLPNAEVALDGAVDPYFKGSANLLFKLDGNNETQVELEEAYLQTTSLPGNLQVKAGQFFAAFGRQNPQHPHQWSFVDSPIILARTLGPEGLRNPGAQISWLLPTPFYSEAMLGVFDGSGGTAWNFRNGGGDGTMHGHTTGERSLNGARDLLYVPRLAASFDLTDQQTVLLGTSAAFAPNLTSPDSRSEIYGVDLYWKWKSTTARQGFPFVAWQSEGLYQRFGAGADATTGLPPENLRDWGFYSQLLWGFRERWVAALRGEYAAGNKGLLDETDLFRGERHRISPSLTFYPSEFSKIRLQYNRDDGASFGTDHSVWLQVEFLLGAHGSHQF